MYHPHSKLVGLNDIMDVQPYDGQCVIWLWKSAGQITAGDYFKGFPRDAAKNYRRIKTEWPTHWMAWPKNWPI